MIKSSEKYEARQEAKALSANNKNKVAIRLPMGASANQRFCDQEKAKKRERKKIIEKPIKVLKGRGISQVYKDCANLFNQGFSTKETAKILGKTYSAVANHKSNYKKQLNNLK